MVASDIASKLRLAKAVEIDSKLTEDERLL